METIITSHLIDRGFQQDKKSTIVDPEDIDSTISVLRTLRKNSDTLEIYDCAPWLNLTGNRIPVSDHVNRTGVNPLVGRQKKLNVEFIDLTSLYVKKTRGVTTFCCGNHPVPDRVPYPSMFLSTISILARALDYKEIHAYVVC